MVFSRPNITNLVFSKSVGLEIFENFLSSWPFFKSIEVYIVKSKIFPFLKEFGTFHLQAPDNSAFDCRRSLFVEDCQQKLALMTRCW